MAYVHSSHRNEDSALQGGRLTKGLKKREQVVDRGIPFSSQEIHVDLAAFDRCAVGIRCRSLSNLFKLCLNRLKASLESEMKNSN